MRKQRVFREKPKPGSIEWQRKVIREEAREYIKFKKDKRK